MVTCDLRHRMTTRKYGPPGIARGEPAFEPSVEILDSIVIGAGQAGLSSSYHLTRRGIDHVVLDANPAPGGAWQHRWDALTMHDVHRVADLPDEPIPAADDERANAFVPAYFAAYETQLRPARDPPGPGTAGARRVDGLLRVETDDGRGCAARSSTRPAPGAIRSSRTTRAPRRSSASSCTPSTTRARALPRQAGARRGRWRLGGAVPRRDPPAHRHGLGRPGVSRSGAPASSTPRSAARSWPRSRSAYARDCRRAASSASPG